jgi:acetyltransferase-like isoleucine patch superfamily enzyme
VVIMILNILKNEIRRFLHLRHRIIVGDFTYGHKSIRVHTWGEDSQLIIGKYCSIAKDVSVFLGGNHNSGWISTFPFGHTGVSTFGNTKYLGHPSSNGDVIIGNDVWIGHGTTIMSGVSIGDGAIIAANSHLVKNVLPYEIWGGNPARFIKHRFNPETTNQLFELRWWDYPVSTINEIKDLLNSEASFDSIELIKDKIRTLRK